MKVRVIKKHPGEGHFPTFVKGTNVLLKDECKHYLHWYACVIDGYETYVPESYIIDGKLIRDYNPTELIQDEGTVLYVLDIVNAWLLVKNEEGVVGWIPAESVVSTC